MAENRTAYAAKDIQDTETALRAAHRALAKGNYGEAVELLDDAAAFLARATTTTVWAWRGTGAAWSEIGERLKVSRQAAWERFSTTSQK